MIVECAVCWKWFDDEYRLTYCPHSTFAANDGRGNFSHHHRSYLAHVPPSVHERREGHGPREQSRQVDAIFHAFHRAWTFVVGTPGYVKAEWFACERQLIAAGAGPAPPLVRASADPATVEIAAEAIERAHWPQSVGSHERALRLARAALAALAEHPARAVEQYAMCAGCGLERCICGEERWVQAERPANLTSQRKSEGSIPSGTDSAGVTTPGPPGRPETGGGVPVTEAEAAPVPVVPGASVATPGPPAEAGTGGTLLESRRFRLCEHGQHVACSVVDEDEAHPSCCTCDCHGGVVALARAVVAAVRKLDGAAITRDIQGFRGEHDYIRRDDGQRVNFVIFDADAAIDALARALGDTP